MSLDKRILFKKQVMDVINTITTNLNTFVFEFSTKVSQRYDIPLEELLHIWCDQQHINFNTYFSGKCFKQKIPITPQNLESVKEEEEVEENLDQKCEYIFLRGAKKGMPCSIIAKSGNFCSKHKKN